MRMFHGQLEHIQNGHTVLPPQIRKVLLDPIAVIDHQTHPLSRPIGGPRGGGQVTKETPKAKQGHQKHLQQPAPVFHRFSLVSYGSPVVHPVWDCDIGPLRHTPMHSVYSTIRFSIHRRAGTRPPGSLRGRLGPLGNHATERETARTKQNPQQPDRKVDL